MKLNPLNIRRPGYIRRVVPQPPLIANSWSNFLGRIFNGIKSLSKGLLHELLHEKTVKRLKALRKSSPG